LTDLIQPKLASIMTIDQRLNHLPAKLKALRAGSGLTQEAVSAHLGVSASLWGHLETGRSIPSLETVLKICHAFRTNPSWLFSFED
jgi:transcriptional regulator with XRE-family HTH domain